MLDKISIISNIIIATLCGFYTGLCWNCKDIRNMEIVFCLLNLFFAIFNTIILKR